MATVQMPKTVKVGVHTYTILRKPKSQMPKEDGEPLDGCCDFNELQISIRKGLRSSKAKEHTLHETLHACTYPSMAGVSNKTDEEIVDAIAPTLLQVLRDNPGLLEYLTQ